MARKPRVHVPGGYYHVMMRGNMGSELFFSEADYSRFFLLLQEGIERYGHRVLFDDKPCSSADSGG
jgi:hypothetical protein